jgi:hypothetical protein
VPRLRIAHFSSATGKSSGIEKGIFTKTAPLSRTRSQRCYITKVCACARLVECGHNTNRLRGCVLLSSAPLCMYRQAYGQIWPPNKFQFRTYFTNNVYCAVPGPVNTAPLLYCFMCKGPVDNVDNASTDRWSARTGCSKARRHRNAQSFPVYL